MRSFASLELFLLPPFVTLRCLKRLNLPPDEEDVVVVEFDEEFVVVVVIVVVESEVKFIKLENDKEFFPEY